MLTTRGMACACRGTPQWGHAYGQAAAVWSMVGGNADARGVYARTISADALRLSLPPPCSAERSPSSRVAPSSSACLREAGLSTPPSACQRVAASRADASTHSAPATTGAATDVPDSDRQPPPMADPCTSLPYATTSGLTRPAPPGSSHVVTPRDENGATASP